MSERLSNSARQEIIATLESYGAPGASLCWLDEPSPDNIDYLDLVRGVSIGWDRQQLVHPDAVLEVDRSPIIYVIRRSLLGIGGDRELAIRTLQNKLAYRGHGAWLAEVEHGQLTFYALGASGDIPQGIKAPNQAKQLVQTLFLGRAAEAGLSRDQKTRDAASRAFQTLLLRLVVTAGVELLRIPELRGRVDDVLSLVGRTLYARFLIDRGVITSQTFGVPPPSLEACFSTASLAAQTCHWLDDAFNGGVLPLNGKDYEGFFNVLPQRAFDSLDQILYHAPGGQLSFVESWGGIDFSHVPVGLLSEVYERFAHDHGGMLADGTALADLESIHYTPRAIAEYMLDQAMPQITGNPKALFAGRILDPAAGAGLFLVLAYRRLVQAQWRYLRDNGKGRPTRQQVRDALYNQIAGFDINQAALTLAALALCLTALELDPNLHDTEGRKFSPMMGSVLINTRGPGEAHPNPHVLGSLGEALDPKHRGAYDLVIGNPPWSQWRGAKGKALNTKAEALVRRIARTRASMAPQVALLRNAADAYENPYQVPDLPFVWRAMEWAKPGGAIAFALHARLLFHTAPGALAAREQLFAALKVTGILNGSALRQTRVWPKVAAQWMLLFAVNSIPDDEDQFDYVNVYEDGQINDDGRFRVDYGSALPIELSYLRSKPYLLKTLFRGTAADSEIVDRIRTSDCSIEAYAARLGLYAKDGYQISSSSSSAKVPPSELDDLPELRVWSSRSWPGWDRLSKSQREQARLAMRERNELLKQRALNLRVMPRFDGRPLLFPRDPAIYQPPLLIIRESLVSRAERPNSWISAKPVFYSESFWGYSAYACEDKRRAERFLRFLHVLTHSSLFDYYLLLTSPKYGVERDSLNKTDLEEFPMPQSLLGSDVDRVLEKAEELSKLITAQGNVWRRVDRWVARIYGLNDEAVSIIDDTLSVGRPSPDTQSFAYARPNDDAIEAYRETVESALQRYVDVAGRKAGTGYPKVTLQNTRSDPTWRFLDIRFAPRKAMNWQGQWMRQWADDEGASRILVHLGRGHIGLGLLSQNRYWTQTRARTTARELFLSHNLADESDA